MGQDTPDWGGKYVNQQFYPLDDLAELAVRLGSPVTYDRRGAVIWMYGFEHGIGDVEQLVSGVLSAVELYAGTWETAPFGLRFTIDPVVGSYVSIYRLIPVCFSKRMGFQASVRVEPAVSVIYHNIYHYDGTKLWYSYLYVDLDNLRVQIFTAESGLVTVLEPLPDLSSSGYFFHLKLVTDLADHSLVRGLLDDHEFDLSAYHMASTASVLAPHVRARLTAMCNGGVGSHAYVDNLIVTANEP
jgi:hypothetical protein